MIKAVIFDFDGVLVDSHGVINELFTRIANKRLNLGITEEDFAKYPGLRFEKRVELIASKKKLKVSREEILKAITVGRKLYFSNKVLKTRLFPGTLRLLDELHKAGIKIGLGTNGSRNSVMKSLEIFKVEEYFDSIVTFDDVKFGKPEPDLFLKNAEDMHTLPENCVVVEDSVEGIIAAKDAGMKVIALTTTTSAESLKDANLIVKTINDLNVKKILEL
jgi:HAD superfamily hydrolase (TIGR01509 family)